MNIHIHMPEVAEHEAILRTSPNWETLLVQPPFRETRLAQQKASHPGRPYFFRPTHPSHESGVLVGEKPGVVKYSLPGSRYVADEFSAWTVVWVPSGL